MMNGQVDLGGSLVLIDTQWNVNYCLDHFPEVFKIVLIDTQWNVNQDEGAYGAVGILVLIDTQWNVN